MSGGIVFVNTKSGDGSISLGDVLKNRTVKILKDICDIAGVIVSGKKSVLIERIFNILQNEDNFRFLLKTLNRVEYAAFVNVVMHDECYDIEENEEKYIKAYRLGFVEIEDKFSSIVVKTSREIKEIFNRLEKESFKAEQEKIWEIEEFAVCCTNLYGVIFLCEMVDIYMHYYGEIDEIYFVNALHFIGRNNIKFITISGLVASLSLYKNAQDFSDKVEDIILSQKGKSFYYPPKEEFLRYYDEYYYEATSATTNIKNFLDRYFKKELVGIELGDYLCYSFSGEGSTMRDALNLMDEFNLSLNHKQLGEFAELISELNNNSRMFVNKGHTPIKTMKENSIKNKFNNDSILQTGGAKQKGKLTQFPIVKTNKVGRNDPCPCGSGKKYKHCCGK